MNDRLRWSRCSPTSRRGRPARGPGRAALDEAGLAHADAGRGLGRRAPGRAPGLDRRGRACAAATDKAGAGTRSCAAAIAGPRRLRRRRGRARAPPCRRASCWPAGAPRGPRWPRRWPRCPEGTRLPWFGPPMSATSMATARFMETWAHGRDVAAALGVSCRPTTGSATSCTSGVRTRGFAFANRGLRAAGRRGPGRPDAAERRRGRCGPGRRRAARSPARRTTSRCWSPSGCTARTPTWWPSAPTPTRGSTSRRPSPGPPGRGTAEPRVVTDGAPGRQLQRLLRRPALRDARDARSAASSTCSPATTSPS